ncbi:MAG: NAD-dependent epimerase/dehydratase family protein [Bacteroidetes bacterium]|nr:NAD-dependent epimerase/dehydratase family protein [Bacteroidota bacterium]
MKIAVTGANGHVGYNLCKSLLDKGFQVKALTHKHTESISKLDLTLVKGDLLDKTSLLELMDGVDVVFHLAAQISITGDPSGSVYRINAEGTRNMLSAAKDRNIKRFIHFSSIHAFCQDPQEKALDENRPLVGSEAFAYDRSKAEGERFVMEAARNGLDAIVLSPTAIIGPADPEPGLTGKAVLQLLNHKIPALVPGGYNWIDVRDVVNTAISAIEKARQGQKYLVSGKWHSLKELSGFVGKHSGIKTIQTVLPFWSAKVGLPFITMFSKLTGSEPLYTSESLEIVAKGSRLIDNTKSRTELGLDPRPLDETICDLYTWFKDNNYLSK